LLLCEIGLADIWLWWPDSAEVKMSLKAGDRVTLNPPDDASVEMLRFKGLSATVLDRAPVFMPLAGNPAGHIAPHYFVAFQGTELPEAWPEPWMELANGPRD
jgi:hypothetical protein